MHMNHGGLFAPLRRTPRVSSVAVGAGAEMGAHRPRMASW